MVGAQLQLAYVLCSTFQVNSKNMMMNLKSTRGHIYSEGIMLALAGKIGKQSAHDLVHKISNSANKTPRSLKSCLVNNEKVMKHLSLDDIEAIFDYKNQLGLCPEFVDKVVKLSKKSREDDKRFLKDCSPNE
jgi:adenylosuccinate lyase